MAEDNIARRRYPISRSNPSLDPGSRPPETDPLTELARLIGQTNPFGEQRASRADARDHEWPGSPSAPAYAQPLPVTADYRDEPRYAEQQYSEQQYADQYGDPHPQHYSPPPTAGAYAEHHPDHQFQAHTDYGQGEPAAPYYGDNGELSPDDPYAHQHYDYDEPAPRRRSGLITVAAVAGLALVGTGGAYAYRTFFSGGVPTVPPLIKADAGPNKVVPAQQSGDAGANKQIYDRVGSGGQTEKIVSREEQPIDVKPANTRPAYVPATGQMATAWPSPPGATVVSPGPGSPGAGNPATGSQSEPRKVRTVDEDAGRHMLDVDAGLEVIRFNEVAGSYEHGGTIPILVVDLVVGNGSSDLEAVELARIASGNVPEVILAPRGRHREAAEGRRVIANGIMCQAVAVTPGAAHACAATGATPTTNGTAANQLSAEAVNVERHPVGGNERARAVNEDRGIVRSLRLQTNAQLAEVVALDEPERLQGLDIIAIAGIEAGTRRAVCTPGQVVGAVDLDVQHVARVPARRDGRLAGQLEVGTECRADTADIGVLLFAVVPPHHLLGDPAGQSEGHLAVALADCRGLELSDTLLEISAAVVDATMPLFSLDFLSR